MNNDFLYRVAIDLRQKFGDDLSDIAVVFPNKRAALYLNEYLVAQERNPIWSPSYFTMSELFAEWSHYQKADDLKLICELYGSFCDCLGKEYEESLDHFFGWGQILLSDFNDVDKCMADTEKLFANLHDLKVYDQVDYLTKEQKDVLRHFFLDFSEERITSLKERFMHLWQNLFAIYQNFNQRLRSQGLSYEGAQYREVATNGALAFPHKHYVFVGIHAPLKAEQCLFDRLQREGNALFYWDYDQYYLPHGKNADNEAGFHIAMLLKKYPNEFENSDDALFNNWNKDKQISYVASPTLSMQARYVSQWLREDKSRIDAGRRTAVVLCDEKMLPLVTHSIPSEVEHLNVTVGYPLSQTPATDYMRLLFHLQGSKSGKARSYTLKFMKSLLNHPYSKLLSELSPGLAAELVKNKVYYPRVEDLKRDAGLCLLFKDIDSLAPEGERIEDRNCRMGRWLLEVIQRIAVSNPDADPLFKESIFRLFTVVNRVQSLLESGELRIDFVTYERLLEQIIHSNKIPYHGEPVVGLQIMGLLETRNLDFDHLLVLGCNEGNVPKTSDNPSFIPYLLREAFELTTPVHQDSVYAYHFYRMLQRAKDVTLVYGNVTDNTNRGERSRFMSQLLVESGKHITQKILQTNEESVVRTRTMVEKDAEIQARLNHLHRLSPSALNKYMRCELLFYYSYILGIRDKDDNLDGEIDNKLFGSIFHDASEFMYDTLTGTDRTAIDEDHPFAGPGKPVKREMLEWALKKESGVIDKSLTEAFENDLFGGPRKEGGQREYNGLQLLNRQVIRHYLEKLLSLDLKTPSLSIRGLEGNAFMDFPFEANGEKLVKEIGGRIDRLDETEAPGNQERCIRVVDYKTGAKLPNIKNLEEVFSSDAVENHSDYFFQVMLYSMIVSQSEEINPHHLPVCPALLFIQKASEKDYTPIISFSTSEGKKSSKLPIDDIRPYISEFKERLAGLLGEIFDYSYPFHPTTHTERCINCDLKDICGKTEKR